jgi:hypothetical protein
VLIDNRLGTLCLTLLAPEAEGHEITTIEGLMHGEHLGPVQQALSPGRRLSMRLLYAWPDCGGGGSAAKKPGPQPGRDP